MTEKWFIAEEENAISVFPYIFGWHGWARGLPKHNIRAIECGFFEFSKGNLLCGIRSTDFAKTTQSVLKKFAEDKKFLQYVEKNVKKTGKELTQFTEKQVFNADLTKKSNKDLFELYKKFGELQTAHYGIGIINSAADMQDELSQKIQDYLEQQNKNLGFKENVADAFSVLTTPSQLSLMQKQDIEFFKTLQFIQEKKITDLQKFPELMKKIEFLEKNFGWLSYHYQGPVEWTKEYYLDLLKTEMKSKVNASAMVKELESRPKIVEKKQKELIKKFQISKEMLYWINIAKSCVFHKGMRKEFLIKSHCLVEPLIKEISKRLGLAQNQTRFIMPDEMQYALLQNKFNVKELNSRFNHCITLTFSDRDEIFIGFEAEKISQNEVLKPDVSGITELKGVCACSGKAKGIARKINRTGHIPKMNQGDILISSVTSPNLVPAMKKASAIVTDRGGLASHAAIVSRELGKPCVIGTKIATKVLNDGDLIEVDAGKALVKILERKKE